MTTATETKRDEMYARIEKHGMELLSIFPHATQRDPVKLCKRLRQLEAIASAVTLRLCNGPEYDDEETPNRLLDAVLRKVDDLLGNATDPQSPAYVPTFVNRDPRGYALKIRDAWMRAHDTALHRDWGGYGILAPDLTEGN